MLNIGISCRITEADSYNEMRNSLAVDWINYFNKINLFPILIPHGIFDIHEYLDNLKLDGIIISGGNNVNPKLYSSNVELNSVYDTRDLGEFEIIKYCLNNKIPLLGVCRGMFIINIFFNGSLTHNVKKHVNVKHEILTNRFNGYFNNKQTVNSFHKHAIKKNDLALELECFAISQDEYVEGIFNLEKLIFGIQWHPEREPFDKGTVSFIKDIMRKKIK